MRMAHNGGDVTFQADQETLQAVIIGAVLATAGGFAASQLEALLRRRERERGAALLFGELLTTLQIIMKLADETRGRGDPYGPITIRFVRAAQRETEIYDRNRETLFDIRNPAIRARIRFLFAQASFSLDGIVDASTEIGAIERTLRAMEANDPFRSETERRLQSLQLNRQTAFDFALEITKKIAPVLTALAPLAKHAFDAHDAVLREQ